MKELKETQCPAELNKVVGSFGVKVIENDVLNWKDADRQNKKASHVFWVL